MISSHSWHNFLLARNTLMITSVKKDNADSTETMEWNRIQEDDYLYMVGDEEILLQHGLFFKKNAKQT